MNALETLRGIARDPAGVAEAWRARGGRVLGSRCLFVPDEVIWAAGLLPHPLYGTPEPVGLADTYFQSCTCEFVRNVFDRVLAGQLRYLDGLVLANTCDVVRHLFDIWLAYVPEVPIHLLNNPQKLLDEGNRPYWVEELRRYRSWVETIAQAEVTDDRLRAAIAAYNETRALLRRLYALREQDSPPLSGVEALDVCQAVTLLPRDRARDLLTQLLGELDGAQRDGGGGPRLMVTGSVVDHPALFELIEDQGATVVVEDLCNTTRTFWHDVPEADDPLEALYARDNARPLCACMHPIEARIAHLVDLAERYRVEGVVHYTLKYCHAFLYEAPLVRQAFEKKGIPTIVLEVGHDLSGHGQLRTRLQAFIEMVDLGVV